MVFIIHFVVLSYMGELWFVGWRPVVRGGGVLWFVGGCPVVRGCRPDFPLWVVGHIHQTAVNQTHQIFLDLAR